MKRTYQPSRIVRKEGMDLDLEWEEKVVENLLLEEEQKEEKKSLHNISSQNDQI